MSFQKTRLITYWKLVCGNWLVWKKWKIRQEQEDKEKERDELKGLLSSPRKLKNKIKKELQDAEKRFGDDRRSPISVRSEAQAFQESDLLSSDPITVVVSEKGWIRSAKGHEVDPTGMNYKSGDEFKLAAKGKSNESVILIDSTGRSYALAAHSLPSARGQGEPISGRLNPPSGANFEGLLMGADNQPVGMATMQVMAL